MFRPSADRLRAWLARVDDVLGDDLPPEQPHPHRRPVRLERRRRPGSVTPRPTLCLCPVRRDGDAPSCDRVAS